ncbi:MAG: hypothetical protein JMDDDDMK_02857 [Acidobacteria bacterium]|nr:hypothetical protein [Acidobacteriota bacterium]
MPNIQITLPVSLTAPHLNTVLKYFERANRISPPEWKLVFEAFDLLGRATVKIGRRRITFRQFYEREVERRYADDFLNDLLATDVPEAEGETLQQKVAFNLLTWLEQDGLYHSEVADSEYLAAYCLYWWTSFARGYRFEVAILRELQTAGIVFTAHDLRIRAERFSPYDLVIDRRLGDIKHTTYFLHTARALPLQCDFYITRLYHARRRRYQPIVILTEETWRELNGAVTTATLETAAEIFPAPAQIVFQGKNLIVVTFDLWKERVKRRQQKET